MLAFEKLFYRTCTNLNILRFCSSKSSSNSWELHAAPFSNLNISLNNCNVKVTTADPVASENKMFINLFTHDNNFKLPDISTNNDVIRVEHNEPGSELEIETPVAVNLKINVKGSGCVDVSSIETDDVNISTEHGDIFLSGIKATTIACDTLSGTIKSHKYIHGNVSLTTREGIIDTGRVQGPVVEFTTEEGNINGQDIYADDLMANSVEGDITFKSIHGTSEVNTEHGNIFVGIASGKAQMSAPEGDLNVFITKQTDMFLHTNRGNVDMYNGENNGAKIFLEAYKIDLNDNVKASEVKERPIGAGTNLIADLYGGGPPIVIKCGTGTTTVKGLSWIQRIGHIQKRKIS